MNEHILKTELALTKYLPMKNEQVFLDLKIQSIPKKVPISTGAIKQYLIVSNLWMPIKTANTDNTNIVMDSLREFSSFDVDKPEIEAVLVKILDALILDVTAFTKKNKTDILALGDTMVSRADVLGISDITMGDIERARA